jgi:2'-5' RNA ligase
MHGVVTLLDREHNDKVEGIWKELEMSCGLKGILLTPIAHFSWHVAAGYDTQQLNQTMQEIAASTSPFIARTAGIGIFTGASPVVYISLVKDDRLLSFHDLVYQKVNQLSNQPVPYYAPSAWMPHITLAAGDTSLQALHCALEKLVSQTFEWEILVDNLALISQAEGHIGERSFAFQFQQPQS